jgi:hypothetical protein
MDSQKNPDIFLGARVPVSTTTVAHDAAGYITPYSATAVRTVADRDYLSPIPTGQISLYTNGALKQNPGW